MRSSDTRQNSGEAARNQAHIDCPPLRAAGNQVPARGILESPAASPLSPLEEGSHGFRVVRQAQPHDVNLLLTPVGFDDNPRRESLLALVHYADDLEWAGAIGVRPADGVGMPGLTPTD